MFYNILLLYIALSSLFIIFWQNILIFIALFANLTIVTAFLYFTEPDKGNGEFNYQKKAILVHKRAENTVFLFFSTMITIFILIFFLDGSIYEEMEIQGSLLAPILIIFTITIPAFVYLRISDDSKNDLVSFISDSIINNSDENEISKELIQLIKELNLPSIENRRNLEIKIYDKGKILVDDFIKLVYPELDSLFFKKNFVVLSSMAILDHLTKRILVSYDNNLSY